MSKNSSSTILGYLVLNNKYVLGSYECSALRPVFVPISSLSSQTSFHPLTFLSLNTRPKYGHQLQHHHTYFLITFLPFSNEPNKGYFLITDPKASALALSAQANDPHLWELNCSQPILETQTDVRPHLKSGIQPLIEIFPGDSKKISFSTNFTDLKEKKNLISSAPRLPVAKPKKENERIDTVFLSAWLAMIVFFVVTFFLFIHVFYNSRKGTTLRVEWKKYVVPLTMITVLLLLLGLFLTFKT